MNNSTLKLYKNKYIFKNLLLIVIRYISITASILSKFNL